jgi:hypothetical protein
VTGPSPRVPIGDAPRPVDLATRLDGQRGWLNELDRKLKKRSIIALLLTCLAVGVAAAALYISITKNSDSDRISALETRIEALEAASQAATTVPAVPTEPVVPETGVTDSTGVTGSTDSTDGAVTPSPAIPAE